jgi:integrase
MTITGQNVSKSRLLTETQIKNAKSGPKPIKLVDTGGLFLLVQTNGAKLWRYRYWLHKKESLFAMGRYPDISLSQARELHRTARGNVAQGVHPVRVKQEALLRAETGTFRTVVESWRSKTDGSLRAATVRQRTRELKNDILSTLGSRNIEDISRLELFALITKVEKRAPETARNLRSHLQAIFEHAIDAGLVTGNPTPPLRSLKKRRPTHHASLPATKVGLFLKALDESKVNEQTKIAMWLVLLTAARKDEIISATWDEFDLDTNQWTIPGKRMKAGLDHWVPLSKQAKRLLLNLRSLVPVERKHLFPNRVDPNRPMANRSLNAVMERLGYGDDGTPHGMRSAFSTYFNKLGANPDVVEHCLAHVPKNQVRAAYNRNVYEDERRTLLQEWADHLDVQRSSANS